MLLKNEDPEEEEAPRCQGTARRQVHDPPHNFLF